jgi:endogenous inhibitor of DNA gyrase (YacG/DUF329 family)
MPIVQCIICKKEIHRPPSQIKKQIFCGNECYHIWRKTLVGELNCHWKGGKIIKTCVRCGKEFQVYPSMKYHTHCSLLCANRDMADAQKGIVNPKKIHYGKDNGSWKGGITPLNVLERGSLKYNEWRKKVFERDDYTCQKCGIKNCYLEAHHIKSWAEYPKLRYILDNGITYCVPCHAKVDKHRGKFEKIKYC